MDNGVIQCRDTAKGKCKTYIVAVCCACLAPPPSLASSSSLFLELKPKLLSALRSGGRFWFCSFAGRKLCFNWSDFSCCIQRGASLLTYLALEVRARDGKNHE